MDRWREGKKFSVWRVDLTSCLGFRLREVTAADPEVAGLSHHPTSPHVVDAGLKEFEKPMDTDLGRLLRQLASVSDGGLRFAVSAAAVEPARLLLLRLWLLPILLEMAVFAMRVLSSSSAVSPSILSASAKRSCSKSEWILDPAIFPGISCHTPTPPSGRTELAVGAVVVMCLGRLRTSTEPWLRILPSARPPPLEKERGFSADNAASIDRATPPRFQSLSPHCIVLPSV
jgi:hypothetical protein